MNTIGQIKERLKNYAYAKYESGDNYIRVLPLSKDTYSAELILEDDGCIVFFNGWHERFDKIEEGLDCFTFGLSTDCRLKESRCREVAYRWTLEYKQGDEWVEDSTTALLIYPYFGKKEIKYLQSPLIDEKEQETRTDV